MYTKSHNMLTFIRKADTSQIRVFKHHLDSLISVTNAVGSINRLDELLEKIMHYALTVTGAARGFLFLYSHNMGGLTLEVMRGVSEELYKEDYSFETYRVSREIIRVVENTGIALIGRQEDGKMAKGFRELSFYGVKQALCVPFKYRGNLLGFLYLDHSFERDLFREQELRLIESFATLTSIYIENSFLMKKFEKQRHENFSITITPSTSISVFTIISIEGILDAVTMKHVDEKILPFIEHEASDVIIDLSNLDYTNKTGIMCLMKYLVLINSKKRMIRFVKPPQHVYETFEISGVARRIEMYNNIDAAINSGK